MNEFVEQQLIIRNLRVLPRYKGRTNVVVGVQWDVVVQDIGSNCISAVSTTDIPFDPNGGWIEYRSLSEADIVRWIQKYAGDDLAEARARTHSLYWSHHERPVMRSI